MLPNYHNTEDRSRNIRRLISGTIVPLMIRTDERIFQVVSFDGETILCNMHVAQLLITNQECKTIKHLWDHKFTSIGKKEVLEMG